MAWALRGVTGHARLCRRLFLQRAQLNCRYLRRKSRARIPFATADAVDQVEGISLYSQPQLYKQAFSIRDISIEVNFLQNVHKRYTNGQPLNNVLELGCGPASHSIELSSRGVSVWALDLGKEMLAFAAEEARTAGVQLAFLHGDMRRIQDSVLMNADSAPPLPDKLDMVYCLLGTFSHMLSNQDALDSMASVHRQLNSQGLFVIELAHPESLFNGSFGERGDWEVELENGQLVLVQWGGDDDIFDPMQQVVLRQVTVTELKNDELVQQVDGVYTLRQYTVNELDLLSRLTGFKVVGLYGELDTSIDLGHEDADRLVVVLQKQ